MDTGGKNDNLYLIRYNLNEHVTVSEKVKFDIGGQMAKKYGSSDSVTIIDPNDSEFKRSYTTTKVSGEGDNQTISVQEHTGYATFQGWNTSYYGDGQSVTPGSPYSFTDLASKAGSHLIRLYDRWKGKDITIEFSRSSDFWGSRKNLNVSSLSAWKVVSSDFIPNWNRKFDYWDVTFANSKNGLKWQPGSYVFLDENIIDFEINDFRIKRKAMGKPIL